VDQEAEIRKAQDEKLGAARLRVIVSTSGSSGIISHWLSAFSGQLSAGKLQADR
jgi:hypothetical protein